MKVHRPPATFVATSTLVYALSEWIKYEFMLTPTTPTQPIPIHVIEWGPVLVTQIFAMAAILGTIVLLMKISGLLYRKPSQCASSSHLWRLLVSVGSGALACSVYFLGVMGAYALWNLTPWTYQLGIVAGMQYPLFLTLRFASKIKDSMIGLLRTSGWRRNRSD
jgi:hypothetical protein